MICPKCENYYCTCGSIGKKPIKIVHEEAIQVDPKAFDKLMAMATDKKPVKKRIFKSGAWSTDILNKEKPKKTWVVLEIWAITATAIAGALGLWKIVEIICGL